VVNVRRSLALAVAAGAFACVSPVAAAPSAPLGGLGPQCIADPSGPIDFEGRVGVAGGVSNVKIFRWSDAAEFYVDNIASQLGSAGPTQQHVDSLADLQNLGRLANQIPGALAQAHTAQLVAGNFRCLGFAPGRYIFLSQVYGGGGEPGDAPAAIGYYRADVDVSTLTRHATVVVRGFRRIGSYPPGS
jgi:hypothetical protein